MPDLRTWIETAAAGIEALAAILMVGYIAVLTARWLLHSVMGAARRYEQYRMDLGRTILVGLELLVAADIVRTVALEMSLRNVLTLAALVAVRTFLGWSLTVEIEGRWPWQPGKELGMQRLSAKERRGNEP